MSSQKQQQASSHTATTECEKVALPNSPLVSALFNTERTKTKMTNGLVLTESKEPAKVTMPAEWIIKKAIKGEEISLFRLAEDVLRLSGNPIHKQAVRQLQAVQPSQEMNDFITKLLIQVFTKADLFLQLDVNQDGSLTYRCPNSNWLTFTVTEEHVIATSSTDMPSIQFDVAEKESDEFSISMSVASLMSKLLFSEHSETPDHRAHL